MGNFITCLHRNQKNKWTELETPVFDDTLLKQCSVDQNNNVEFYRSKDTKNIIAYYNNKIYDDVFYDDINYDNTNYDNTKYDNTNYDNYPR